MHNYICTPPSGAIPPLWVVTEHQAGFPVLNSSFPSKQVKVAQSCPTLCHPMDHTVHGILQARILEWVPFSSPGDLPNPGIKPRSPTLQVDSLPAEPQGKPSSFLLAIYLTRDSVYMSTLLSQFSLPSPSPAVSTSLFCLSASQFLPCK